MSTPITDRPIKVGVVGLGFMGLTHINAYRKIAGVDVVAVCDAVRQPVNGVLTGIAGNVAGSDTVDLGASVCAYSKIEDLLADDAVDLVDLCLPTPLHVPQTLAALQAGKHVICEKPLVHALLAGLGMAEGPQGRRHPWRHPDGAVPARVGASGMEP